MAPRIGGWGLVVLLSAVLALDAWGLAAHAGFLPVASLRTAAPVAALMLGAALAHAVARVRAERDVARAADPGGRALFLGVVMVVATGVAWVAVVQAVPALLTRAFGERVVVPVQVTQQLPPAQGDGCTHWIEVSGAALPRPVETCVSADIWRQAPVGASLRAEVLRAAPGLELEAVHP